MTPQPPPGQGPVSSSPPGMNAPAPMRGAPLPPPGMYPPPFMMMPPPKQGGGFAKAILVTLATTVFGLSLMLNVYLILALSFTQSSESSAFKAIETPLVEGTGGDASQKVAIVKLEGVITSESVKPIIQLLDAVQADGNVKALVLEIDSPGGAVTPSDELYARVVRLKAEKQIPIYVSMGSLAASGGYYVAMAADKLYASETTMTGSIGVLFQRFDLTEFAQKYGIKDGTIVSDGATFKDSGSMLKPLDETELAYFKSLLNDAFDTFKDRIKKGRPNLTASEIEAAANGKIYSAKQAMQLKLIDAIGYLDNVAADAAKAAGLNKPLVVRFERELTFAERLFGAQASASLPGGAKVSIGPAQVSIDRAVFNDLLRPRPMYLWQGQ